MKTKLFAVRSYIPSVNFTLLLLRVVFGLAMMLHGWGKIQAPMNWMGPDSPVPGFLQFLAAFSEFGGGFAIMIGLLTPLAALGMSITMLVAVGMHAFMFGDPFVASGAGKGSYEPALMYFVLSLFLMTAGPGKHSLDRMFFGVK